MAINKFWDWHNEFTMDEASRLMAGYDPKYHAPAVTDVVKSALSIAINRGELEYNPSFGKIHRYHLVKWLTSKGQTDCYFRPAGVDSAAIDPSDLLAQNNELKAELEKLRANRWPWGSYETKDLKALAAAAQKFWANYDPDDKGTAPRNEEVISWLHENHKIAVTKGEQMASILRADGLKTGPR
jgi:hypothetical protein